MRFVVSWGLLKLIHDAKFNNQHGAIASSALVHSVNEVQQADCVASDVYFAFLIRLHFWFK